MSKRSVFFVRYRIGNLLFLLCLAISWSLTTRVCFAQTRENFPWGEIKIIGNGTPGPYPLGDYSIIEGTEEVWIDSVRVNSQQDYEIDWSENQISLLEPLPPDKVMRVKFRKFSPSLQRVYRHREIATVESSSVKLPQRPPIAPLGKSGRKTTKPAQWQELQVSGIKSLAVTVGSDRDLSLEQTLRLNISGRIEKETEVLALLTDQNSPIQPEGNTERLQDLDKVLVQIKRDNLSVVLGDYDLSFTQTELGRYEHKLQGIYSQFASSQLRVALAGALSRGQFTTNEFIGSEGNQGPYQLRAKEGNINIVVIAGSEKVWLNGELLKRGENNDYVIEYGNGQVTFTPRRLITTDSRITVDFEYSHQEYKRNSWGLRSEVDLWDNKAHFGLTALREGDERKNPLAFVLNEAEQTLLETVGDNSASAWVSGVDSSTTGKGHYTALYDTLPGGELYRYYQFDPQGQSGYNLSFSWVGEGGDYSYIGGGIYKYVDKSEEDTVSGEYMPRRFLPLPTAHHIEVLDFNFTPVEAISLSGEIGSSNLDLNTFSSQDDGDNVGRAYKLNVSLHPSRISLGGRGLGSVQLDLRYRSIDKRFRPLGRTSEVEEKYQWGISTETSSQTNLSQQEDKREIFGSYHFTKHSALNFEYGELKKQSDIRSKRRRVSLVLEERKTPHISYHWDLLSPQRAGDILRQKGRISWGLWKFIPEMHYESEFRSSKGRGEGFQHIGGGFSLSTRGPLNWLSKYEKREERLSGGRALAFTQQHRVQIKQWHSLTLNTGYSRRRRRFPEKSASEQRTDLADIDVRFSPLRGAIISEVHYQLTSKGATKKLKNYLYGGKEKGCYIWEDVNGDGQQNEDEFIPDPNGDYILYIEQIGESQPVSELDSGLRLAVEPRKILSKASDSFWNKILKEFSSQTSYQVQRKTSRDGSEGDALRDRSVFQQDISLFGRSRKLSLYFKHRNCRDLSNEYYSGSDRYSSRENSVKIRSRFLTKSVVELGYTKERRERKGKGIFANYQIDSHKLRGEFSHRPVLPLELLLRVQLGKDWEAEKRTKATWISLTPGFSYRLRGKGKFWTQLDYANVHSNKTTLIYQMAEGKRRGTNLRWNTNFDYRFSQYTSFSFAYYGRKQPEREAVHSLKAEMRAYF